MGGTGRQVLRRNIVLLAALVAPWPLSAVLDASVNQYYLQILGYIGINVILAVSLNLINGFTGQFSLGHAGFMAVGAYAGAAASTYAWPGLAPAFALPLSVTAGGILAAATGLLVGAPTLRLRGDYLAIATLGFGEIIRVVILNNEAVGGARGFSVAATAGVASVYTAAVLCVATMWRLVYSPKGRAFVAIREDEIAAAAMGINTTRFKIVSFVIGAFWAGVAGALFAHYIGYIHTNSFQFLKSVEIVTMVVLGGMGSITGSVLAAVFLTVLPELLRGFADYRMVVYSLVLIVTMLTRPSGLLGSAEITQWRFWKSKTAR